MKQYYSAIEKAALFAGIDGADYPAVLACLDGRVRPYHGGETVFLSGDPAGSVGVVLSGAVHILREDVSGNHIVVARMEPGDMFGEAYAFAKAGTLPVSALCVRDTEVLFLDFNRMLASGQPDCGFHALLVTNMLGILANKNILLNDRLEVLSRRRMRDKILAYLWPLAQHADGDYFEIPFNREELAGYLGVDRSALSAELGRMQNEGLIEFWKNRFRLTL